MAKKNNSIIDIDEFFEKNKKTKNVSKATNAKRQTNRFQQENKQAKALQKNYFDDDVKTNQKSNEESYKYVAGSRTYLTKLSNQTLKSFVDKHQKTLNQRIEIVKEALKKYKQSGQNTAFEECKRKLKELNELKDKKLSNISAIKTKEEYDEIRDNAFNNEEVKEFEDKIKELKKELQTKQPNVLVGLLDKTRKALKNKNKLIQSDIDDDDEDNIIDLDEYISDNDEIIDLDSELDNIEEIINDAEKTYSVKEISKMNPSKAHEYIVNLISDKTGLSISSIKNMKLNDIRKKLKEFEDKDEINDIKEQIEILQAKKWNLINKKMGYNDVTDVLNDIFDYEENNPEIEQEAKNIIASSVMTKIINMATSICYKLGKMNYIDDAIAYGGLALSSCLDRWYKIQKIQSEAIAFQGFMSNSIKPAIERGLLDLGSNGVISGTLLQTRHFYNKKRFNELKVELEADGIKIDEFWEQQIINIVNQEEYALMNITNASDFAGAMGGEDADGIDYSNYESRSGKDLDTEAETKIAYQELIKNIGSFIKLFEIDKNGKPVKHIFTIYDCLLFRMFIGLDTVEENGKSRPYTREEMAEKLTQLYTKNGKLNKTLTGSAVSNRIFALFGNKQVYEANIKKWRDYEKGIGPKPKKKTERIIGKIEEVLNKKPALKEAWNQLYFYIINNRESYNAVSKGSDALNNELSLDKFEAEEIEKINETVFKNTNIDLSMVLGDSVTTSDESFFHDWDKMVDYSGIK